MAKIRLKIHYVNPFRPELFIAIFHPLQAPTYCHTSRLVVHDDYLNWVINCKKKCDKLLKQLHEKGRFKTL